MYLENAWQVGESTLNSINSLARIGFGLVEATQTKDKSYSRTGTGSNLISKTNMRIPSTPSPISCFMEETGLTVSDHSQCVSKQVKLFSSSQIYGKPREQRVEGLHSFTFCQSAAAWSNLLHLSTKSLTGTRQGSVPRDSTFFDLQLRGDGC